MKKSVLFFSLIVLLSSVVFAGGPVPVIQLENNKNVENPKSIEKPVEKPKMIPIEYISNAYFKTSKHFTAGIGFGGNPMIGFVEKDGFGYPKCEYGVTWVLGYG